MSYTQVSDFKEDDTYCVKTNYNGKVYLGDLRWGGNNCSSSDDVWKYISENTFYKYENGSVKDVLNNNGHYTFFKKSSSQPPPPPQPSFTHKQGQWCKTYGNFRPHGTRSVQTTMRR